MVGLRAGLVICGPAESLQSISDSQQYPAQDYISLMAGALGILPDLHLQHLQNKNSGFSPGRRIGLGCYSQHVPFCIALLLHTLLLNPGQSSQDDLTEVP